MPTADSTSKMFTIEKWIHHPTEAASAIFDKDKIITTIEIKIQFYQ
jgi:hypothetical protein